MRDSPYCRNGWKKWDGRIREDKKEAPAIDEGEEARLCGGLWTQLFTFLNCSSGEDGGQLFFSRIMRKICPPESRLQKRVYFPPSLLFWRRRWIAATPYAVGLYDAPHLGPVGR